MGSDRTFGEGHARSRRTMFTLADQRVAGTYERTAAADKPDAAAGPAAPRRPTSAAVSIECRGLIAAERMLTWRDLSTLATIHTDGQLAVALVDVFAALHVEAAAEVLVVRSRTKPVFGVPLHEAVRSEACRLVLDGPIRLDIPGWTVGDEVLDITVLEALSFREFVGCG